MTPSHACGSPACRAVGCPGRGERPLAAGYTGHAHRGEHESVATRRHLPRTPILPGVGRSWRLFRLGRFGEGRAPRSRARIGALALGPVDLEGHAADPDPARHGSGTARCTRGGGAPASRCGGCAVRCRFGVARALRGRHRMAHRCARPAVRRCRGARRGRRSPRRRRRAARRGRRAVRRSAATAT